MLDRGSFRSCFKVIAQTGAATLSWLTSCVKQNAIPSDGLMWPKPRRSERVDWSEDVCAVQESDLFDAGWYVRKTTQPGAKLKTAAKHYVTKGARAGDAPSAGFDGSAYHEMNPDVMSAGFNPLLHYIRHGISERRAVSPTVTHFMEHTLRPACISPPMPDQGEAFPSLGLPVIFICHSLVPGEGAPRSLMELVTTMKSDFGVRPIVFSPVRRRMADCYESAGIRTVTPLSEESVYDWDKIADSFRSTLSETKPGIVIANTSQSLWLAAISRRSHIPTLSIIRESSENFVTFNFGSVAQMAASKEGFKASDQLIFVSKASFAKWQQHYYIRAAKVIYNGTSMGPGGAGHDPPISDISGIALISATAIPSDAIVLLSVGTINPRKSQIDIVEAFALLPAEIRNKSMLVFVGSRGDLYANAFKDHIRGLGPDVASRIMIFPETRDIDQWYRRAGIFVFASRREAYPRVIIEALSYGLPIISSSAEGVSEQIVDRVSGLIFEAGNIPELSYNMETLIESSGMRRDLSAAARARFLELPNIHETTAAYFKQVQVLVAASGKSHQQLDNALNQE